MADFLTLGQAQAYLLRHFKALEQQLPFGDPFVFVGAFTLLNRLSDITGKAPARILQLYADYKADEANVVQEAGRLIQNFTLTVKEYEVESDRAIEEVHYLSSSGMTYTGFTGETPDTHIKKVNLSHKDRDHMKRKDGKLTLSAGAFLEDLVKATNGAFNALSGDQMSGAKATIRLNEQPLIGHGD